MIYSRTTIQLLMKCQRLIQQEFKKRIALDNEQVVTMILAYSAQSTVDELKDCATALSQQFLVDETVEPDTRQSHSAKRVYRGQLIEKQPPTSHQAEKNSSASKTIIYRGQKVKVAC